MFKRKILLSALSCTALFFSCSKNKCIPKDPDPGCICTMVYDPVCGCDGKTYGNACQAACHNIQKYTKGECK